MSDAPASPTSNTEKPEFLGPDERAVVVETASSTPLRDLASFERDFELAAGYLRHYLSGDIEGDRTFASPLDALWTAAVVIYARAFSKGVRATNGPSIDRLSSADRELHDYVIDVRNKYLAHSVNGFEHTDVVAFLVDSPKHPKALSGIGTIHTALSRMERSSCERFLSLCESHLVELQTRSNALRNALAAEVIAAGAANAYALPDHARPNIDQRESRSRRK